MTLEEILLSIEKDATKSSMNKLLKALRKATEQRDIFGTHISYIDGRVYDKEIKNKELLEILEWK